MNAVKLLGLTLFTVGIVSAVVRLIVQDRQARARIRARRQAASGPHCAPAAGSTPTGRNSLDEDSKEFGPIESCGGRLLEERIAVRFIDYPAGADQGTEGVIGIHDRWLLDGEEVTAVEAEAFRIVWETDQYGSPRNM